MTVMLKTISDHEGFRERARCVARERLGELIAEEIATTATVLDETNDCVYRS